MSDHPRKDAPVRVGVISDTHGKVLASVHEAFAGVGMILHAGDIGSMEVLTELETLAPVKAVTGNTDPYDLRQFHPEARLVELPGMRVLMVHGHHHGESKHRLVNLAEAARANDAKVVIHGHSHVPCDELMDGVRILNPGSASQPRGRPHPTVALLHLDGRGIRWELVNLAR